MGSIQNKSSRNSSPKGLAEKIALYQEEQLRVLANRLARIENLIDQEIKGNTAQELYLFARELLVKIKTFSYDPEKSPAESKKELQRVEKAVEAARWALERLEEIAAGGIHYER